MQCWLQHFQAECWFWSCQDTSSCAHQCSWFHVSVGRIDLEMCSDLRFLGMWLSMLPHSSPEMPSSKEKLVGHHCRIESWKQHVRSARLQKEVGMTTLFWVLKSIKKLLRHLTDMSGPENFCRSKELIGQFPVKFPVLSNRKVSNKRKSTSHLGFYSQKSQGEDIQRAIGPYSAPSTPCFPNWLGLPRIRGV